MNNILSTILINTYSLSQLKHRLTLLKSYLERQIFGIQTSQEVVPQTDPWITNLPQDLLSGFNKDNLTSIFQNLESEIANLEVLTLYLTFDPGEQTLTQLGEHIRKTFGSPRGETGRIILLDIKYDPNLIAGAAFVWKGIYKDYSLRSKIEEKKSEILQSFQQFSR